LEVILFVLGCLGLETFLATGRLFGSLMLAGLFGVAFVVVCWKCGRLWNIAFRPHFLQVCLALIAGGFLFFATVAWIAVRYGSSAVSTALLKPARADEIGNETEDCRGLNWLAKLDSEFNGKSAEAGCGVPVSVEEAQRRLSRRLDLRMYLDRIVPKTRLWIWVPTALLMSFALMWPTWRASQSL
jgi:hypothetical protein